MSTFWNRALFLRSVRPGMNGTCRASGVPFHFTVRISVTGSKTFSRDIFLLFFAKKKQNEKNVLFSFKTFFISSFSFRRRKEFCPRHVKTKSRKRFSRTWYDYTWFRRDDGEKRENIIFFLFLFHSCTSVLRRKISKAYDRGSRSLDLTLWRLLLGISHALCIDYWQNFGWYGIFYFPFIPNRSVSFDSRSCKKQIPTTVRGRSVWRANTYDFCMKSD